MQNQHRKYFLQASNSSIAKARALRKRMTPEEKKLWSRLRDKSFGVKFRKQVPFGPYILDFFCISKKVAVELDGDHHYTKEHIDYDASRDEYIRSHNITVLRFRNGELTSNLDGVLTVIWEVCNKKK